MFIFNKKLIYFILLYNIKTVMFKKIIIILITTLALTFNVSASSDGDLLLKKMNHQKSKIALKHLTGELSPLIRL